jgi:CheY-like chemotaxis protein
VSRIVVIEEDRLMRGLLVEWLNDAGHAARAVAPGDAEAMHDADLVIVDVYMPRLDGARRLDAVKAAHPDAPVIAISAQFRPGLAVACSAAAALGVQQVIAKPFSRRDLLHAVDSVLHAGG